MQCHRAPWPPVCLWNVAYRSSVRLVQYSQCLEGSRSQERRTTQPSVWYDRCKTVFGDVVIYWECLPSALFALPENRCGDQSMTWSRRKKATERSSRIRPSRLLSCEIKGKEDHRLEPFTGISQNRNRWPDCIRFCCVCDIYTPTV